jgi:UDP-glucose 4-epimerase
LKILITGGTGFIGSHLTQFLKKDHDVTIYDIKKPIEKDVKFILGDIIDGQKILQSFQDFDTVIHLAAAVGVENTETNPILTLNTNILGTKNILEACKKHNIKKVILASSSEIYGEPRKVPIDETQTPIPITTYGISKLASEEYLKSYAKTCGFNYSILRFFNVVGPKQSSRFVLPEFIKNALNNKPLVIHGNGLQIRAFCHIADICQGIEKSICKGDGEIFNIGNDLEPITIENLAKKVISVLNSQSTIKYISFEKSGRNREQEIMTRIPSIQKAKKILSYQPEHNLKEIINSIAEQQNIVDFEDDSQSIQDT